MTESPDELTIAQAASLLGCSVRYIRKKLREDAFPPPVRYVGRSARWSRGHLLGHMYAASTLTPLAVHPHVTFTFEQVLHILRDFGQAILAPFKPETAQPSKSPAQQLRTGPISDIGDP
jgi:predicted DNA-binding transcriptional regulator AlpA